MNKKEYAKYLGELIDEEINLEADLEDQFYAYFQCFMPDGEGLEKVFEPIENGEAYYKRLIQIYEVTEEKTKQLAKQGVAPGYFCPSPVQNEKLLIDYGKEYILNMQKFAKLTEDEEFIQTMQNIKDVEINKSSEKNDENETNYMVSDCITGWYLDNTDYDLILEVLSEAYYSVECCYFLSYYFQHPRFEDKIKFDLFKPYFQIWKMGYDCWFDEGRLIIGK